MEIINIWSRNDTNVSIQHHALLIPLPKMHQQWMVKTSLMALLASWTPVSAYIGTNTTSVIKNQTHIKPYRVSFTNKCNSPHEHTYLHFLSPFGSIHPKQGEPNAIRPHVGMTGMPLAFAMASNETRDLDFVMSNLNRSAQSTWRLWWDAAKDSAGSRNQTLLEVTCEIEIANLADNRSRCWVNVSNVDGLTSSLRVKFLDDRFPSITVRPPKDWQCPKQNRYPQPTDTHNIMSFLPPNQACVSNCSLLNTDEACCRNANNTRETCSRDSSPAIKAAAQEAYSFAYDDNTPYFKDNVTVMPLRAHDFVSGTKIFHVTLCY
jgi:hypothetical protein